MNPDHTTSPPAPTTTPTIAKTPTEKLAAAMQAMQYLSSHEKDVLELIKRFAHDAGLKNDPVWMQAHIDALEAVSENDHELFVDKMGHAMGVVSAQIKKHQEGYDAMVRVRGE